MAFDFVVHPIRWDRCPLAAADSYARSWLTHQSRRGLAANTLDAYSRALERYLAFMAARRLCSHSVTRGDLGTYLSELQGNGVHLSNATIQQLLTVVRLFHVYLMEEGARSNNPAAQRSGGRAMIARFTRLPWIPNEEDWQSILAAARYESIRCLPQRLRHVRPVQPSHSSRAPAPPGTLTRWARRSSSHTASASCSARAARSRKSGRATSSG